ncbi:MAG: hypothetical protein U5R30_06085 [Deltaproteobacteria bacterium]|nr:hypothetical protein [Deltaproteobacteria bacterium]
MKAIWFPCGSLVELVKSSLKILFVGGLAYVIIRGNLDRIPTLARGRA